ncbi:ABC transporter substrate-binding protein [Arthrobacter zhaoguopingii]|uniref:ABC transporter substrate-binding protein n=1 Tax=Arthrobacter zhaoguopingii TaxID=2681491 RepID=UPI00135ACF9C|nr:ABC transporter substrate-binding protein [Arthrobacter zhaoguopingii]
MTPSTVSVTFCGEPPTLNPLVHAGKHLATATVMAPILHSLVKVGPDGRYRGQLAFDVPHPTEGGHCLHYRIRENARWHDGVPISVDDVRFTWEIMLDPGSGVPERDGYNLVRDIRHVSDREFVLELDRPYSAASDLFTSTTGAIMPAHLLRNVDFESDWPSSVRPASGPYRYHGRTDSGLVLHQNPSHVAPATIDQIQVRFATTDAERAELVMRGEVDVATFDRRDVAEQVVEAARVPLTLVSAPSAQFEILLFNTRRGVFASRERRRSWATGLDRHAIAADAVGDTPLNALLRRPGENGYEPAFSNLTAADCDEAERERDQPRRLSSGPVRLIAVQTPTRMAAVRHIERFAARSQLGLVVDWVESRDLVARLRQGNFDAALIGLAGNPDPAGHATLWRSVEDGGQNYAGIADRAIDKAFTRLLEAVDPEDRQQTVREAERALAAAVPAVPLYTYPTVLVHHDGLLGPAPYPYQSGHLVEVETWKWRGCNPQNREEDSHGCHSHHHHQAEQEVSRSADLGVRVSHGPHPAINRRTGK